MFSDEELLDIWFLSVLDKMQTIKENEYWLAMEKASREEEVVVSLGSWGKG